MNHVPSLSAHIPVLDHLRGFAALSVFAGHFNYLIPPIVIFGLHLKWFNYAGGGVEMFFAISGFVIPYSMYQRGHTIRQSGMFLLRRMARLEPPYLACIALILCLNAITRFKSVSGAVHPEIETTAPQLLAHLGYLNALLGYRWLNSVFWTLAIEFQFYLFCVVAYPLIFARWTSVRMLSLIAIALLGFAGIAARTENPALLPYWLPLFALGMTACCLMTDQLTRLQAVFVFAISLICGVIVNGPASTLLAAIPVCAILVLKHRELWRFMNPLAFAGTLSYSIYLLHLPIGVRVAGLLRQTLPNSVMGNLASFAVILFAVLCVAWLFHRFIEKPAQRWSKTIGLGRCHSEESLQTDSRSPIFGTVLTVNDKPALQ